jgi:nucleoid-associated protein YgaU
VTKVTIFRYEENGKFAPNPIVAQFNPTEFSFDTTRTLATAPALQQQVEVVQHVRGGSDVLRLELFFDTTESGMGPDEGRKESDGPPPEPVTKLTDPLYRLMRQEAGTPGKKSPPVCWFAWGSRGFPGSVPSPDRTTDRRDGFKCVVESVTQRFTLFSPDGVPLRAVVTLSLREFATTCEQTRKSGETGAGGTNTHVVKQGETVSQVAAKELGDPKEWRKITDANGGIGAGALAPGTVLNVPVGRGPQP